MLSCSKEKIETKLISNTTIQLKLDQYEIRLVAVYKSPKTILQMEDIPAEKTFAKYLDSRNDTTVAAPLTPTRYSTEIKHSLDILDISIIKTGQIGYLLEKITN